MSNSSSSTSIHLPSNAPTQPSDAINKRADATKTYGAASEATAPTATPQPTTTTQATVSHDTNVSSAVDSCDDDYLFDYETQPRSLAALAERDRRREQLYLQKLAQKQQHEQQQQQQLQQSVNTSTDRNVLVDRRRDDGASIQANAIDSSSAMIVNESRVSCENNVNKNCANDNKTSSSDNSSALQIKKSVKNPHNKNINNNNNLSNNRSDIISGRPNTVSVSSEMNQSDKHRNMGDNNRSKVSAMNVPVSTAATGRPATLPPKMSNFDAKKGKPGFLSRFTNFRFSLRGSKKKLKSLDNPGSQSSGTNNIVLVSTKSVAPYGHESSTNNVDQVAMRNKNNNSSSRAGCYQRNSMRSNEFEYIPLKDPIAVVFDTPNQHNHQQHAHNNERYVGNATNNNTTAAATTNSIAARNATKNLRNDNNIGGNISCRIDGGNAAAAAAVIAAEKRNAIVTSKPPLPLGKPRIVGVCAKQSSTLNSSSGSYQSPFAGGGKAATLAQSSPHREGAMNNRRHAQHQQRQRAESAPREINFDHTDNANNANNFHYLANDYQLLSSRQSNELSSRSRGGFLKGAVSSDGLLMDVNDENSFCTGGGDEDDDGDDDGKIGLIETNLDTDETIISGKTRSLMELGPQLANRSNATIANHHRLGKHSANGVDPANCEPRRPHKSMEFLLDKENQRFVLVSFHILLLLSFRNFYQAKIIKILEENKCELYSNVLLLAHIRMENVKSMTLTGNETC